MPQRIQGCARNGMNLHIDTKTREQTCIIDVRGEVDLYSSPKMREAIFSAMKQRPLPAIIVDLTHVTYTDSSGIATLVEGLQISQERQARFKLVGLSQAVLEVFQLARLETVFEIYPTLESALLSA